MSNNTKRSLLEWGAVGVWPAPFMLLTGFWLDDWQTWVFLGVMIVSLGLAAAAGAQHE